MVPFIWNVQARLIHRDGMWISFSKTGAREKEIGVVGSKMCLPIRWILFFGVMKVFWNLDNNDSCTTLSLC